ncbi:MULTISPECIES: OmpA family protein [Amycolatopsis]|uniref:OmpA family protein n=1 Tax=Amycolatopsis dendrobii TaxID=2760662 RepID=A0A7W3W3G5_9PSEU|nr:MULTISPECIES: OmpA family protein [Amycolatopsis]MBB1158050.1 OmpA family protein [Amycolatopsis dendrobii]UKD57156.1 OmpA family protein [Amycolatopsis sp. FU40]
MISLRPRGNSGRPFPAALAFAAAAALLSACAPTGGSASGSTAAGTGLAADGCTAAPDKPVSLVVGARAGSQRPAVAAGVQDLLSAAVQNQQSVQVFRVDGQPSRALKISPVIKGKNESQRKQEIASAVQQVAQAVSGLGPKKPEADDLTALSEAGKLTGDGGTVVLMDSGLSTTGTISFRDSAMFDADPGELANFLAAKHLLPELKNKAVFLAGLGLTADPQPALDGSLQKKVVALWQAVAAKAGATCTAVLPLPDRRQDTVKTDLPVSKVDVPAAPVFRPCGTTVLRDSGPVGFLPNTARLRDEKGAHDTLQTLVSQLAGGQKVTLTGNTATFGSPADSVTLSKQRAETVKALLVKAGIAADRITTVGAGQNGPGRVRDIGPDGTLDPVAAAQNRSVVVELSCG